MEVKEKDRKKIIVGLVIMIILSFLVVIGVSYAYWQITKVQETKNVVATGCFNVTLTEKNPINLALAAPVDNTTGMSTTPYTFTIKNTCQYNTSYVVNLESLANTTFKNTSIRVALNNSNKLYSEYQAADKYYNTSKDSRRLTTGTLAANGSVTYNLRLWVDSAVTVSEASKVFESKIIVTATNS